MYKASQKIFTVLFLLSGLFVNEINAQNAILGNYRTTNMVVGSNKKILPDVVPINAVSITATSPNFQGILTVNPGTGIISVTNAKQAGVFQIQVNAFDSNNQKTSTNFQITVTNPAGNPGYALGNFWVNIGDSPQKLAIGDFNNDGIQDIAAAAYGTSLSIFTKEKHEVTIAIGSKVASGQFIVSTINYDREVRFVTVGDFNGDGNQDLAVNVSYSTDHSLTDIYLGRGNGQFDKNPQSLSVIGLNHLDCTLGDFNQDGIQDLSISSVSWGAYSTQMFLGLGDGNFSEVNGIGYGFLMRLAVTYADFNGDGIIDIICSKMNGAPLFEQSTYVKLGKGDGTFGTEINLDSRFGILSTGDFNKDGKPDIVKNEVSRISILLGNGNGISNSITTKLGQDLEVGKSHWPGILDFNGDGFLDVVAITSDQGIIILLGDGTGNLKLSEEITFSSNEGRALEVGDFNGDGKQDIAFANYSYRQSNILFLYAATPNIGVQAKGITINNGDNSPSLDDGTDLGIQDSTLNLAGIYLIKNTGNSNLSFESDDIQITGDDASLFKIDESLFPIQLAPDSAFYLNVFFEPISAGEKTATVEINYNKYSNSKFTFRIKGTGKELVPVTMGAYPAETVIISGENTIIKANEYPLNVKTVTATTDTKFDGILSVDPETGDIRVTNALSAGTFLVTVTGYIQSLEIAPNLDVKKTGAKAGKTTPFLYPKPVLVPKARTKFYLTVSPPNCSPGTFKKLENNVGNEDVFEEEGKGKTGRSLAIGDFNRDGKQDVITVYSSHAIANSIDLFDQFRKDWDIKKLGEGLGHEINGSSIRLGTGSGSFTYASKTFQRIVGFYPRSIVVEDLDGDGKQDIAVANDNLVGNVFTASAWEVLPGQISLGYIDFFLPYYIPSKPLGFGLGTPPLSNLIILPPTGIYAKDLTVGDFNNDGILDIATVNSGPFGGLLGGSSFAIDLGGLHKYSRKYNTDSGLGFTVGNYSLSIAKGDFNNDGNEDIVTASAAEHKISVRMGDGTGDFSKTIYNKDGHTIGHAVDFPVGSLPSSVVVGDFNNDGKQDVAVTCRGVQAPGPNPETGSIYFENGSIWIGLGGGDGTFALCENCKIPVGLNPSQIKIGDFNGDGNQDLAVTNEDSDDISIRYGNGDGTFYGDLQIPVGDISKANPDLKIKFGPVDLVVGDFNEDHIQDLAVLNSITNDITFLEGLAPVIEELVIKGNGIVIPDTDNIAGIPTAADNTDLGYAAIKGSKISRNFTIENTGTTSLTLESGAITFEGANSALFETGNIVFPATIKAGATVPLTILFSPESEGIKTATVRVTNTSCLETTEYTFTIQGTVIQPPKLGIYSEKEIIAGANTVITPDSPPKNTIRTVAFTDAGFTGSLLVNPSTGSVTAINANPGTHEVSVRAFTLGEISSTTTFNLIVLDPIGCSQVFTGITAGAAFNATGLAPTSVAVGDFNNDLFQDIAIANKNSSFISIKFGDGKGGLAGSAEIPLAGNNSSSVAVTDFDGDGNLDVVVSNDISNTVSIALGNGDGTFSPSVSFPVGLNPNSLAIGDFNNDGNKDLITSNVLGGSVSVLFGDGTGSFIANTEISVGSGPHMVAVGDFNGDNDMDFATVNFTNNTVSIQLGNGDGTFTGTPEMIVGSGPVALTIGDFNGDTFQDIATANATANTLSIRLGDGAGNFSGNTDVIVSEIPNSIVAGDLNADGIEDLAVSTITNPQIIIYQGDGAGNFTGNINNLYGSFTSSIIADLNGDGFMDLAQAQTNLNTTEFLLGAGPNIQVKGNNTIIQEGQDIPALSNRTDLGFVQVGSSYTQIFTIENTGNASLTLGSGSISVTGTDEAFFTVNGIALPATIAAGSSVTFGIEFTPDTKELKTATLHIASDDCNNADYDFAIQGTGSSFTLPDYPGLQKVDAGGNITITPASPPINTVSMYAFTDINFKGSFLVNPTTGSIQVINPMPAGKYTVTVKGFENLGTDTEIIKTFELEVNDPVCSDGTFNLVDLGGSNYNLYDFVLGDFDGDGNQDLTSISSNKILIRIGNSTGGFGTATEVIVANMDYLYEISLGDFNGDGNLDFIASGRKANLYYLLVNLGNGDGTFGESTLIPLLPGELTYAFGDFNGDGIQDIVFPVSYNLSILTGNRDGSFTRNPAQSISVFGADDISAGDFNKDGAQDLAILRFHTLYIVLGDGTGGFKINQEIDLGPTWTEKVVIGDFNNDGNQDIAANTSQTYNPATPGYLAIFLGNGNGSFSNAPAIAIDNIRQLAIGDFNGDGSQDLALGTGDNNVSILLGKGNGTFNAAKDYAGHNKNFVIVDFNKDGKQDILGGSTSGLTKLLGRGKINIKEGGLSSNDVIIADGDNSPSEYKRTDFGNTCISNSITKTYAIENNGSSILNLANGSITISGSSEFKIEGITLPASVNPDESIKFTVRFLPTTPGLKTATIHVANNDCSDGDYDFAIKGIGDSPQIEPVIVGSYADVSIMAGENISITPDAVPENTESAVAYTNNSFPGNLTVNPITGLLTVTNAKLAGTYEITVEAFGLCKSATTSFILTVTDPLCSAGTFTITEGIDTGDPNKTILLADINRDGILDLVIAQNQKILVRLGNGDATFRESTVIDIDNFPSGYKSIAIGDFNGDGSQDIVSTAAQKLSVYLGDGKDNFVLSSSLFMTNLTAEVAVTGDFNMDGRLDIIVKLADETINESLLSVFLGDGFGGFTNRKEIAIESWGAGVTSGDFNNDGKIDIAVANTKTKTVSIRLGDGLGGFSGNTELVCGVQPKSITVGDFNRDGKQDLAVTITGDGFKVVGDVVTPLTGQAITIFMGRGNGTFNAGTNLDVYDDPDLNADYPWSISVGDYNGDGIQDLALDMMLSFTMPIYLGDGAGGFSNNLNLPLKGWAGSIVSGDINGDGRQDILIGDWFSNIISVFLNESPEIEVKSNSLTIADGDNTPSVTDNTNFGNICLTGSVAKTFTIENNGSSDLVLSNGSITLTGADNTLFTLGGIALPKTISANESATFTVTFTPTTLGVKTATLHIANNSCDKADYDFTIIGIGGGADGVPPVITCPVVNDTYFTDAEECYATIGLQATATANCDLIPVITSDAPVNNQYPVGETIVTFTAIDEAGNESACSVTINVISDNPPVVSLPADIAIEYGASIDPEITGKLLATLSCDPLTDVWQFLQTDNPDISKSYIDVSTQGTSGRSLYNYNINRLWAAEDINGNKSIGTQIITVSDNTAPVITCAPDITIQSGASSDPLATGFATATDIGDPNPVIIFTDETVDNVCESVITRTWTATDVSGNTATCVQIIKITDTTPPVISCAADITIEAGSSNDPLYTGTASASDNSDPAPLVTYNDIITTGSCPNESSISRTWTAADACGNESTCIQTIKVTDTTSPVINCSPDISVESGTSLSPSVTGMATASDLADPNPSITYSDEFIEGSCPNESTVTRTWTAIDACGNTSSCIQIISASDNISPDITCVPDVTIEAGSSSDPSITGMAIAKDIVDHNPSITYIDAVTEGSCANESIITRTWTASDVCGNERTCIQIIKAMDTTAPIITCVPDTTIEAGVFENLKNIGIATATDANDANPEMIYTDVIVTGMCLNDSIITRTWTASDACGNMASCVQTIKITDTTPPGITCTPDIEIEAGTSLDPLNTGLVIAIDANDENPVLTYTDEVIVGTCPNESIINRTWTATDACGNDSSCVQIITVSDNTPPEINCVADIVIEAGSSLDPANTGLVTATDVYDAIPEISYTDAVSLSSSTKDSIITRTWSAIDACGNLSACIQMITVERNTTSASTVMEAKGYFKLYPVPAIDYLTIEWLGSVDNSSIQFRVNDMRGRLVDQFKLHSETGPNYYKMDIRKLAPMTYIISTVVDGILMNGKFIKK